MSSKFDFEEMERAYLECVGGIYDPHAGYAGGGVMNKITNTQDYDENKIYFISVDGIIEVEKEELYDAL